jgi:hypothetical protein
MAALRKPIQARRERVQRLDRHGPAGETLAVWERQDNVSPTHDVQASTRVPGGPFSSPIELSASATDPQAAVTPGGLAVVAWRFFDGEDYVVQVVSRPSGGQFSSPIGIATIPTAASPRELQLAVNADGAIAIAWLQKDSTSPVDPGQFSVVASVKPAGGDFTPAQIVSALPLTAGDDAAGARVAIDDAGDVTAAWEYFDGTAEVIQAADRPRAGHSRRP